MSGPRRRRTCRPSTLGVRKEASDNLFKMFDAGVKPGMSQYQQLKLAPMLLEDAAGHNPNAGEEVLLRRTRHGGVLIQSAVPVKALSRRCRVFRTSATSQRAHQHGYEHAGQRGRLRH